jgi:hypothetical protein
MKFIYYIILALLFSNISVMAKSAAVAQVVKLKGKVFNISTKQKLRQGDWISEGSEIATKSRSFVRLLFLDKSKLSIGPKSRIRVEKFQKRKAGVLSLIKGHIRSQVTKDYTEIGKQQGKSKLFIKTKTAAMGVRGTDYQVNYNDVNDHTSIITFEGRVAFGSLTNENGLKYYSGDELEAIVSDATAVMVKRGQFSVVMPKVNSKPTMPVKLNFQQIKALEKNEFGQKIGSSRVSQKEKRVRGIIPPGMKGEDFVGAGKKEVFKQIKKINPKIAEIETINIDKLEANKTKKQRSKVKLGEAIRNIKLKEGGYLIVDKGVYIPPPKDAAIDPISNEIIMPKTLGRVCQGGHYCNDYYNYSEQEGWVIKKEEGTRAPASTEEIPPAPSDAEKIIAPPPSNPLSGAICADCRLEDIDNTTNSELPATTKVRILIREAD